MNESSIFGFDFEPDKPNHVRELSMWCKHMLIGRLLIAKKSQY